MRAVVQRTLAASVTVDGNVTGSIARGLCVLVAAVREDADADIAWLAEKLVHLRIFEDDAGKMNLSITDLLASARPGWTAADGAGILLVPNFTVAGDAQKGRRPGFDRAMPPEQSGPFFDRFCNAVAALGVPVARGVFRAHMHVTLTNDGPITLVLDSRPHSGV